MSKRSIKIYYAAIDMLPSTSSVLVGVCCGLGRHHVGWPSSWDCTMLYKLLSNSSESNGLVRLSLELLTNMSRRFNRVRHSTFTVCIGEKWDVTLKKLCPTKWPQLALYVHPCWFWGFLSTYSFFKAESAALLEEPVVMNAIFTSACVWEMLPLNTLSEWLCILCVFTCSWWRIFHSHLSWQ